MKKEDEVVLSQKCAETGPNSPSSPREQRLLALPVHVDAEGVRTVVVGSDDYDWLLHRLAICPLDDFEQADIAKIIRREMQDNAVPATLRSERAAALILAHLTGHPDDEARMAEVVDAARDLAWLWQTPKVRDLSRADRNSAIEDARNRLIEAVAALDGESLTTPPATPAEAHVEGGGEEFLEFKEALDDLRSLRREHADLNGGGPGWSARWEAAWAKANDLFANEDEAADQRRFEDFYG